MKYRILVGIMVMFFALPVFAGRPRPPVVEDHHSMSVVNRDLDRDRQSLPPAPVPEPSAAFLFGLMLLIIWRVTTMSDPYPKVCTKDFPKSNKEDWPIWMQ